MTFSRILHLSFDFFPTRLYKLDDEIGHGPSAKRGINWEYVTQQLKESDAPESVKELLLEYPKLVDEPIFTHTSAYTTTMRVNLDDDIPVVCPMRELPHAYLEAANKMVADLLRRGIVEYSRSSYRSPVFL